MQINEVFIMHNYMHKAKLKPKAVPLHAMKALGGRGCTRIAPSHSQPCHWMGWVVSVMPRPRFSPGERTPGTHCTGGWVGPRAGLDTEARGKILCPCRGSNTDRLVIQPVVRYYTAWANRDHSVSIKQLNWYSLICFSFCRFLVCR
jgi:hypothetical protein